MRQQIEQKLMGTFAPTHIVVEDESHGHNVPKGAESHFKVVLVSAQYDGVRAVKRHQLVYGCLSEELAGSVHALALHLFTPEEWQEKAQVQDSPPCLGGSKHKA